jgi:hypothetical protein
VWENKEYSQWLLELENTVRPLKSDHIGDGDFWSLWRGWSLSEVKNVLAL